MRSSLLLLALVGMASATAQWQKQPPAKQGEIFPGIPEKLPAKGEAVIRMPGKNPHQWSLILDDGTIFSEQTLLTKTNMDALISDTERYLELLAFAHEYNEWGVQGPPDGFSIGNNRAPFKLPLNRRRRSLDKPVTDEDFKKVFLVVVQKFKEQQKTNKALAEPTSEQLGIFHELLTNTDESTTPDSYQLPQHFLDFFKLAWKVASNVPKEGFQGAIERATKELGQKIKRATAEKRKREAEMDDDEFATIVYNQTIGDKGLDIAEKKLMKRALTGSTVEPTLKLKGRYYLVPKTWSREQIQDVYNDLRKKRSVVKQ